MTHAPFPPGGNLLVPLSSRAACRAGISMWSACRTRARGLRAAAYHGVGLVGTLPLRLGPTVEWRPPMGSDLWREMTDVWSNWFGRFDAIALYRPPQSERAGFAALLLEDGVGVGFVKCRPDWDFGPEADVLDVAAKASSFTSPAPAGVVRLSDWSAMGLSALSPGLHRARLGIPANEIALEIADLLGDVCPPSEDKTHWVPMHGDMGPWNLRHLRRVGAVLFDWEHTRRGPPGSDLIFHRVACIAMGIPTVDDSSGDFGEAVEYWIDEIPRRFASSSTDQRLAGQMLRELEGMV